MFLLIGFVPAPKTVPLDCLFEKQGGYLCRISTERSGHERLLTWGEPNTDRLFIFFVFPQQLHLRVRSANVDLQFNQERVRYAFNRRKYKGQSRLVRKTHQLKFIKTAVNVCRNLLQFCWLLKAHSAVSVNTCTASDDHLFPFFSSYDRKTSSQKLPLWRFVGIQDSVVGKITTGT